MRLRLAGIAFARSGRPVVSTSVERAYRCGRASAASAGAPPAAIDAAQSLMNPRRSMTGILSTGKNVFGVETEAAFGAILEPAPQGQLHGAEGEILPRQ